jgi:hypothetical protein
MQILQNVITPPAQSYAALSQYFQQQRHQLRDIQMHPFEQIHDGHHVRQQRRRPHRRLVQNNSLQTQFDLRQHRVRRNGAGRRGNRSRRRSQSWRRNRSWRRSGRRRRESGNLRRQTAGAKAGKLPPEVASCLLCPSRLRPIVGPTPVPRTQPTPMLAAAERTTQVAPARIPAMGEKADVAAGAGNHANGQFRMRLDSRR